MVVHHVASPQRFFHHAARVIKRGGLLVVADPRLLTKSYGKLFVNSLPNMTKTRKLDVVQRFFAYLARQLHGEKPTEKEGQA
jgi:ATP-dependent DNA helicase DinG